MDRNESQVDIYLFQICLNNIGWSQVFCRGSSPPPPPYFIPLFHILSVQVYYWSFSSYCVNSNLLNRVLCLTNGFDLISVWCIPPQVYLGVLSDLLWMIIQSSESFKPTCAAFFVLYRCFYSLINCYAVLELDWMGTTIKPSSCNLGTDYWRHQDL